MSEIGHDSVSESLHQSAKEHLRAFVDRIERLNEEKAALSADIKEVYAEAKSNGFDVKTIRKIVSMRKKDEHQRLEEEAVLATYLHALGMLGDTPLGQAALQKAFPVGRAGGIREIAVALEQGATAAQQGKKLTDIPYLSDDPRGKAWERGYVEANAHAVAA